MSMVSLPTAASKSEPTTRHGGVNPPERHAHDQSEGRNDEVPKEPDQPPAHTACRQHGGGQGLPG
jgi:hypothetical protein